MQLKVFKKNEVNRKISMNKMNYSQFILMIILTMIIKLSPTKVWSQNDQYHIELTKLLQSGSTQLNLPDSHPLFPAFQVAKIFHETKQNNEFSAKKIIKTLEDILVKKEFVGVVGQDSINIGTVGSHKIWRDTIYTLLGRAYYDIGEYEKSLFYYQGVAAESYISSIAFLEKGWALLALAKLPEAEKNIDILKSIIKNDGSEEALELKIQQMFYLVKMGEFEKAISWGQNNKLSKHLHLQSIFNKIMAQAYFDKYIKESANFNFAQKSELLNKIISHVKNVKREFSDPGFSFLASESYWLLASAYRVESPIKNKDIAIEYLQTANTWISPWVDLSIKEKKTLLTEEAYFFSVALAWEAEQFSSAINRLNALPVLYPQGTYLEDTYQLLGDYYFEQKNFKTAIPYYAKLTEIGGDQKAAYGVYKAAWSYYNLNDKWASLRHFERLMLFYQKRDNDQSKAFFENDKVGLIEESKRDFMAVMAETMEPKEALEELKIFNFSKEELIEYQTNLAKNYQKIGSFLDAVYVYKFLLNTLPKNKLALTWLKELLETHLAAGTRKLIAQDLDHYYPKIVSANSDHSYSVEEQTEFQKSLRTVILTVHKEAKKTDDLNIWISIDALYESFMNHFKGVKNGDIWYYGAQRQEKLNRFWEAINWYKLAAEIPDYENNLDAAHSVLRIAKDQNEIFALDEKTIASNKNEFQKIGEAVLWYVEKFSSTKQVDLAYFIYVDSMFLGQQYQKLSDTIIAQFKKLGDTELLWNVYLAYNKKLYDNKKWPEIFYLANNLRDLNEQQVKYKKDNFLFVSNVAQESSFQQGFNYSQLLQNKELKNPDEIKNKSRDWYRKSIAVSADEEKRLKAYYNYLLSFNHEKEVDQLITEHEKFQSDFKDKTQIKIANKKLFFDLHSHIVSLLDKKNRFYDRAIHLVEAAVFVEEPQVKESLLWEATVIFGSYQKFELMERYWQRLAELKSPIFNERSNRLTIAQLYFYGGELAKSLNGLKPLLSLESITLTDARPFLLLHDLFWSSRNSLGVDSEIHKYISNFLVTNEEKLKVLDSLTPLWSMFKQDQYLEKIKKHEDIRRLYSVAPFDDSTVAEQVKNDPALKDKQLSPLDIESLYLKARLSDVTKTFQVLTTLKNDYKNEIVDWRPQITSAWLCRSPIYTKEAINNLEKIKTGKLQNKQWPVFVTKVDEKINELKTVWQKEIQSCEQFAQLNQRYNFDTNKENKNSLFDLGQSNRYCQENHCAKVASTKVDDVIKYETSLDKRAFGEEVFFHYFKMGAYARAESLASKEKNIYKRAIYLGMIRLALNDPWNAWALFEEAAALSDTKAAKNSKAKNSPKNEMSDEQLVAKLYLTLIMMKNGHPEIALKEFKMLNKEKYSAIHKDYYQMMVQEFNQFIKEKKESRMPAGSK